MKRHGNEMKAAMRVYNRRAKRMAGLRNQGYNHAGYNLLVEMYGMLEIIRLIWTENIDYEFVEVDGYDDHGETIRYKEIREVL